MPRTGRRRRGCVEAVDGDAELIVAQLNEPDTAAHIFGPGQPRGARRYGRADALLGIGHRVVAGGVGRVGGDRGQRPQPGGGDRARPHRPAGRGGPARAGRPGRRRRGGGRRRGGDGRRRPVDDRAWPASRGPGGSTRTPCWPGPGPVAGSRRSSFPSGVCTAAPHRRPGGRGDRRASGPSPVWGTAIGRQRPQRHLVGRPMAGLLGVTAPAELVADPDGRPARRPPGGRRRAPARQNVGLTGSRCRRFPSMQAHGSPYCSSGRGAGRPRRGPEVDPAAVRARRRAVGGPAGGPAGRPAHRGL